MKLFDRSKEEIFDLLNNAIDQLLEMYGKEWLIRWALDNGLTLQETLNDIFDDEDVVQQVYEEWKEENGVS